MKKYTLLKTDKCPWCDKALELFQERGIEVETVDVGKTPWVKRLMLMAGLTTVPHAFTPYGEHLDGYERLEYHLKGNQPWNRKG